MGYYRGGRVPHPDEVDVMERQGPARRHACFANGCPMAGSMFRSIGTKSGELGSCPWHYDVNPDDLPKVTSVLTAWLCVSIEVQAARRMLSGANACGNADQALTAAWERLRPEVLAFEHQLSPVRTGHAREDYGNWARRLEAFLGGQVRDVLSVRRQR